VSSEEVRLTAGDVELTVTPENGCRISGLRMSGTELLRQGVNFGCFPMVPWCGRIKDGQFSSGGVPHQLPVNSPPHAIHGTGQNTAWKTLNATATEAAFAYELTDPWPYNGLVTQTFELSEDALSLAFCVETTRDSFPAQAGWHPWFNRNLGTGDDVRIDFAPAWQEERGDDHLPTGRRIDPLPGPWDDCFGMPDGVDVTLTWPEQLELRVQSREGWVVVYDEQPEAVCVEPQTGPPNGLNTLPRLVTLIDPLEMGATWTWRRLRSGS
jgi:aldose 1-epimerase